MAPHRNSEFSKLWSFSTARHRKRSLFKRWLYGKVVMMVLHGFSWFFIFMLPDQCFLCPCFLFPVSRSLCYVSCGYVSCFLFSVSCFLFPRLLFPVLRFPVSCLRRLRFPFSSSSESKSPTMEDEKVYFLKSDIFRWRAIEKDHILESDLFRWRAVEKSTF